MKIIKKQSFVKGAMILVVANAVSKILGAVFKIPLTYILKEEGMAIFNASMQVYIMVLTLVLSGATMAISKMVAERLALQKRADVHKIVSVSERMLALCGFAGSAVLFVGAPFFADVMHDEKLTFAIQAISPAVFFVVVGLVYKGYYQGTQNMIPTAISQVTEAVIKLAAGYGLAVWLINCNLQITSAGAVLGITIGEVIATVILALMYLPDKRDIKNAKRDAKSTLSTKKVMSELLKLALPLTLAGGVGSVLSVIDVSMIRSRLQAAQFTMQTAQKLIGQYGGFTDVFDGIENTLRISDAGARWLYGAYSGYALTIFHLPPGIVATLGVSILPVVAGAFAVGDMKKISNSVQLALRIAMLIAMPCAVGMFILSGPILHMLFKNTASADMLAVIAPCVISVCMVAISSAVLQATGNVMLPFRNMLIGSAVKLLVIYTLVARPDINILGAPIATNADYFVVAVLNLYSVKKIMGIKYNMINVLVKPLVSAVVMGVVIRLLYEPVCHMAGDGVIGLLVVMVAGGCAYAMSLMVTGAIQMREIKGLFKRL